MTPTTAARHPRRAIAALLPLAAALLAAASARAQEAPQLFRVVGAKDEVTIGLTAAEFAALGSAPGAERLARRLVSDGQLTAWQYTVGRGPDGTTRLIATRRIAILRNEALRIEPYAAALPVDPPPRQ